jgi:predicted ArsR family transcriptional regulator
MTNWLERLTGETQAKLLALLRRSHHTITGLSKALGLTDNAVRTHVAVLRRDGIIQDVGTQRETGGKPARLYGLTSEGEELFPKAYALVLSGLVEEIARTDGRERIIKLLRAVGARAAAGVAVPADAQGRVAAAATAFRTLGGDVEVQRTAGAWRLQGYGCPLSAVTPQHPEVCALATALIEEISGLPVTECCERSERPRCAFRIEDA